MDEKVPDFFQNPKEKAMKEIEKRNRKLNKKYRGTIADCNAYAASEMAWFNSLHPEDGGTPPTEQIVIHLLHELVCLNLKINDSLEKLVKASTL